MSDPQNAVAPRRSVVYDPVVTDPQCEEPGEFSGEGLPGIRVFDEGLFDLLEYPKRYWPVEAIQIASYGFLVLNACAGQFAFSSRPMK